MKINDFFCGAGGMGLGFDMAGFKLSGAWDFDKYAVESYGANISNKVKQADISKLSWGDIPPADVWTFGFPCQDISTVGKMAGMIKGETRSGLFYEIMRLLEETEVNNRDALPSIILAENVKAVKKYLPEIEDEYKKRGYKTYVKLYNSKFEGVPQNRERYFILGVHESIEIEFQFKEQDTNFVPSISSILDSVVEDRYYVDTEKARRLILEFKEKTKIAGSEEALVRRDGAGQPKITSVGRITPDNCTRIGTRDDIFHSGGITGTLCATDYKQVRMVLYEGKIRKLTPREYARLQGFPDNYKQVVSNSQFYKQMGNAVTVNTSRMIALQIREYLELVKN